jgi:glycosyltransferase involved in cell wall biosynthesis
MEDKLKILKLVHTYESVGGLQMHMKALHKNMISRDLAEVHVLYYTQNNNPVDYEDEDGAIRHPVFNPMVGSRAPYSTLRKFGKKFDEISDENDFDLFHVHYGYYYGAYVTMTKALAKKIPVVFSFHGGGLTRKFKDKVKRLPLEVILPRVDMKMGICKAASNVLGLDAVNIGTYADVKFFDPNLGDNQRFREKFGIDNEHLILYPARIEPKKGQIDLVNAAKILEGQGLDYHLAFIGPHQKPGYVSTLKDEIENFGLEEKVKIYNTMDHAELRDGYKDSIVALSSYTEGVPRVVLEGLSMGSGVIATDVGGVSEYITNGETGILVDAHRPFQLAEGISKLVGDSSFAREMGLRGRELVKEQCDLDVVVDRYMRKYGEII